ACMYFYFSSDWFHGNKLWGYLRDLLHGVGQLAEGLYLLTVGYVVVFGGVGFNTPDAAQPVYWGIFFPAGLLLTILIVLASAFGQRGSVIQLFRDVVLFIRNR